MNRTVAERALAWTSIVSGALLWILESLHGVLYGGTPQSLIIDFIAASLLLYAGIQSLRQGAEGAAGLLFGAWAYAFCDAYRAIWWRAEVYYGSRQVDMTEPYAVFAMLSAAGLLTIACFATSFVLAHPRPGRVS
ncbi:MAG: hypothetical protein V3U03_00915 [Myxococcota bacterium]